MKNIFWKFYQVTQNATIMAEHLHIYSSSKEEKYLEEKEFRPIAMQVLAPGALKPEEAIKYVCRFPRIESILFGSSSRNHIQQTKYLIDKYSLKL